MRGLGLVLGVTIAGCGGARAPAAQMEFPMDAYLAILAIPPSPVSELRAPRVGLELARLLPDLAADLRWPLPPAIHPMLEPAYPIARAFAQPELGWLDLCARGVAARSSPSTDPALVAYLRAWCHVARRDLDLAVVDLGRLRHASTPMLAPAVRLDLANILAEAGPAAEAEQILARAGIDDLEVDDLLAATYAEIGSPADAYELNERALAGDFGAQPAVRCARLARRIALVGLGRSTADVAEIEAYAKSGERGCARIDRELACLARPGNACTAYFSEVGIDVHNTHLIKAFLQWPADRAPTTVWTAIARDALLALPVTGADLLATIALDRAVRTSRCTRDVLAATRASAQQIRAVPGHDPDVDEVLASLIDAPEQLCARNR